MGVPGQTGQHVVPHGRQAAGQGQLDGHRQEQPPPGGHLRVPAARQQLAGQAYGQLQPVGQLPAGVQAAGQPRQQLARQAHGQQPPGVPDWRGQGGQLPAGGGQQLAGQAHGQQPPGVPHGQQPPGVPDLRGQGGQLPAGGNLGGQQLTGQAQQQPGALQPVEGQQHAGAGGQQIDGTFSVETLNAVIHSVQDLRNRGQQIVQRPMDKQTKKKQARPVRANLDVNPPAIVPSIAGPPLILSVEPLELFPVSKRGLFYYRKDYEGRIQVNLLLLVCVLRYNT